MRLLLVRHGETVDNVAALYAGVRDSALTTHGVLQATRLGSYLASKGVKISHIYASDLQRAFKTAEALRAAQSPAPAEVIKREILREQDFGYYEGRPYQERARDKNSGYAAARANDANFQDVESKSSMRARMDEFVSLYLVDHFYGRTDKETVVVVAHGIILTFLWREILSRFRTVSVQTALPPVKGLEYLSAWSNTGYMDLEIKPAFTGATPAPVSQPVVMNNPYAAPLPPRQNMQPRSIASSSNTAGMVAVPQTVMTPPTSKSLPNLSLTIKAVNKQDHLQNLKKTGGGIGSLQHDNKQQTMDAFLKRPNPGS